jgi:hypothetical protein
MTISLAVELLLALLKNSATISQLIQKAQGEGRDITSAELSTLVDTDNLARAKLVEAIAAAKAAGK